MYHLPIQRYNLLLWFSLILTGCYARTSTNMQQICPIVGLPLTFIHPSLLYCKTASENTYVLFQQHVPNHHVNWLSPSQSGVQKMPGSMIQLQASYLSDIHKCFFHIFIHIDTKFQLFCRQNNNLPILMLKILQEKKSCKFVLCAL